MARYRKKPVVIDATQWFPGVHVEGVIGSAYLDEHGESKPHDFGIIETLEGSMRVSPGDWIITGVKGEKYPCRPDIFEATYEPAEA